MNLLLMLALMHLVNAFQYIACDMWELQAVMLSGMGFVETAGSQTFWHAICGNCRQSCFLAWDSGP